MTMPPPPVVFELLIVVILIAAWFMFGLLPYYLTGGRKR